LKELVVKNPRILGQLLLELKTTTKAWLCDLVARPWNAAELWQHGGRESNDSAHNNSQ